MDKITAEDKQIMQDVFTSRQSGHSLAQTLYLNPDIFRIDMDHLYSKHWVLVDHVSRIHNIGDYFLVNLAGQEIIVVRESKDSVNAFYNVCRHRGSKVCLESSGRIKLLVCPYHAWSYKLDGTLQSAQLMADDFDPSQHGLHPCHIKELKGIIFLCISDKEAPEFDIKLDSLIPFLDFHGMESAKIATRKVYSVKANWKLVIENFSECYHCKPAHPELCSVHRDSRIVGFGGGPGSGPPEAEKQFLSEVAEWEQTAKELGHPVGMFGNEAHPMGFPMVSRFPFKETFKSESQNGIPVSRLMGNYNDYDGGATAFGWNVWSWAFASNDYAVLLRFTPVNENQTDCEAIWLVHPDAEEGTDYELDKLMWFWDLTLEEDTTIIENNNAGIRSRHYQPGPHSKAEAAVEGFDRWYMENISKNSIT